MVKPTFTERQFLRTSDSLGVFLPNNQQVSAAMEDKGVK